MDRTVESLEPITIRILVDRLDTEDSYETDAYLLVMDDGEEFVASAAGYPAQVAEMLLEMIDYVMERWPEARPIFRQRMMERRVERSQKPLEA